MKRCITSILSLALISMTVTGCGGATKEKDKIYDIKGKVVAVDSEKNKVTLDHEEIPGFMKAMEMPFKVESAKVLEGLKPGDRVQGTLKVQGGDYAITKLVKQ